MKNTTKTRTAIILAMFMALMMVLIPVASGISFYSVGSRDWHEGTEVDWWEEENPDPASFTNVGSIYAQEATGIYGYMKDNDLTSGRDYTGTELSAYDDYPAMITGSWQENTPQWFHISAAKWGGGWENDEPVYHVYRAMPDYAKLYAFPMHWGFENMLYNEYNEMWTNDRNKGPVRTGGSVVWEEDWQHIGEFNMDNLTVVANGGYEPGPQSGLNYFYSKAPFGHATFSATDSFEDAKSFIRMMGGWTAIGSEDTSTTTVMRMYVNEMFSKLCLRKEWSYNNAHIYAVTQAQVYEEYYRAYHIRLLSRAVEGGDSKNNAFMLTDGVQYSNPPVVMWNDPIELVYERHDYDSSNSDGIYVIVNGLVSNSGSLTPWEVRGNLTITLLWSATGDTWTEFNYRYSNKTYLVTNHQYNQTRHWGNAWGTEWDEWEVSTITVQSEIASDVCTLYLPYSLMDEWIGGWGEIKAVLEWDSLTDQTPPYWESCFQVNRFEILERF